MYLSSVCGQSLTKIASIIAVLVITNMHTLPGNQAWLSISYFIYIALNLAANTLLKAFDSI